MIVQVENGSGLVSLCGFCIREFLARKCETLCENCGFFIEILRFGSGTLASLLLICMNQCVYEFWFI